MSQPNNLSEEDIFRNRIFKYANNFLEWVENHICISIMTICIIIILLCFLICLGIIKKIGPIEFNSLLEKIGFVSREITNLPAAKPSNPNTALPKKLTTVKNKLKENKKQNILILCSDQDYGVEIGRLFYSEIKKEKIAKHIGWIHCDKTSNNYSSIEECFYQELHFFNHIENKDLRKSKCIGFFKNKRNHTVLFIDISEYNKSTDKILERYNNLDGLSLILISTQEIDGFTTCKISKKGSKHLCSSRKTH